MNAFIASLIKNGPVLTDGAWGTQIMKRGLQPGECVMITDTLNHSCEGLLREPFDQPGLTGIDIDHSRRYPNGAVACALQQRIELSSDHGVAACPPLQFNLTLNRLTCRFTVRMKIGRPMVALDDCNRTALPQVVFQCAQRLDRP